MDDVTQVVNDAFAADAARKQAAEQSPQARGLRFAVGIGVLAYGLAKHNTYVAIVGGGFLAYWLVTGQLAGSAPAAAAGITSVPLPPTTGVVAGLRQGITAPQTYGPSGIFTNPNVL